MKLSTKIPIILFLILGIIGFFLPWFFFSSTEDYSNGIPWISTPGIIIGYTGAFVCTFIKEKSNAINIWTLVFLLCIPIGCIHTFLTWHIANITGNLSLRISFYTAHYGFYITLISTSIASIFYGTKLLTKKL